MGGAKQARLLNFRHEMLRNLTQFTIAAAFTLLMQSCQDDNPPGGGPGSISRFEGFESCAIIAPPSDVQLNSYYTKYINCSGIPIIGNNDVHNQALVVGNETMEFMLQGMDNVRNKLIERGEYYILAPPGDKARDVPEFANQSWAINTGAYSSNLRAAVSSSAGLLCMSWEDGNLDGHSNVFVHELAHMLDFSGFRLLESGFESELAAAYNNAMSQGLWTNTYAATNKEEYFAQCVQMYFEVGWPFVDDPAGDGNWNHIHTRAELEQYDPTIYNIIASRFNSSLNVPGCIQGAEYEPWSNPDVDCGTSVTDIDGNTYGVVKIGNKCWMSENLKTTRFKDGTLIPNVIDDTDWENLSTAAWCGYNNTNSFVETYGRLYNWHAINNAAGICPDGWHMPTKEEWRSLMSTADGYGSGTAGALKALDLWDQPNEGATNQTGFTALPSGLRMEFGLFEGDSDQTGFWSSDQEDATRGISFAIWANGNFTVEAAQDKGRGYACRCVKD